MRFAMQMGTLVVGLLFLVSPSVVFAATRTWDGGGSGNNCSTAANWSADTAPVAGDTVVFDGTGKTDVTWDSSCTSTVAAWTQSSSFTGSITMGTTFTGGGFDVFEVTGNMTVSGGTITHTGNTTAETYRLRIDVDGAFLVGTGASISANGKGHYAAAAYGPNPAGVGTGAVKTRWYATGGGYGGQGGKDTWNNVVGITYGSITAPTNIGSTGTVNNGGPSVAGGAIYLTVTGATTVHGTVSSNGTDVTSCSSYVGGPSGGSVYITTGSFGGSGTVAVNGGSSFGCGFGGGGGGGGRTAIILTSSSTFGNVTFTAAGGGFHDYWDYVNGNDGGASGTVYKQTQSQTDQTGQLVIPSSYYYFSAADGVSPSTTVVSGVTEYPTRVFTTLSEEDAVSYSFSSITIHDRARLKIDSGDSLTLSSGGAFFSTTSGALFNNGSIIFGGTSFTNNGTISSTGSTSTVTYTGQTDDSTVTMIPIDYYNLTINNTGSTFLQGASTSVLNNLSIMNGTYDLNGTNLTVSGTVSNSDTLQLQGGETVIATNDTDSGNITYNGTSTYSNLAFGGDYYNLTFDGSGSYTATGAVVASGNFTLSGSTFNLTGQNLTVSGTFSNNGILTLQGGETVLATNDTDSGNITYNGSSTYSNLAFGGDYYNLTFDGSGSYTATGALTLSGSLILSGASLDITGNNLNVESNFNNTGGTLTLLGSETIAINSINTASGTIAYAHTGSLSTLFFGTVYKGLSITGSGGVLFLPSDITVNAALSVSANATLTLSGRTLTATTASITNNGTITEGTGSIIHTAILTASNGSVPGSISYTLTDSDENIDGTTKDTVTLSTEETVTLTETSVNSGIFTGSITTACGSGQPGNGVIEREGGSVYTLFTTFTDAQDSTDTTTKTSTLTNAGCTVSATTPSGGGGGGGGSRAPSIPFTSQKTPAAKDALAASVLTSKSAAPNPNPTPRFSDIPPRAWFHTPVTDIINRNIASGYENPDGTPKNLFGPADPVTYAQFAKMVLRTREILFGSPLPNHPTIQLSNQSAKGTWAEDYIAEAEKVFSPYTNSLDVHSPMPRGAVAQTLLDLLTIQPSNHPTIQPSNFSDLPKSHPHYAALQTAVSLNIFSGDDGKNTIRPDATLSRAEAAKLLSFLLNNQVSLKSAATVQQEQTPLTIEPSNYPTIKPFDFAQGKPLGIHVITTPILYLRLKPSATAEISKVLRRNELVNILKHVNDEWTEVERKDGIHGYIYSSSLQPLNTTEWPDPQPYITKNPIVNLRAGAFVDSSIRAELPQGTKVWVLRKVDIWAQVITANGEEGYVSSFLLEEME